MNNFANRECCDIDIRDYSTNAPVMFIDFCNITTHGFESDYIYARINGNQFVKYDSPISGTLELKFQVYPFEIFSLLNGGKILNNAIIARQENIFALKDGEIELIHNPVKGSVFVYDEDYKEINGDLSDRKFISTSIQSGKLYSVGYLENKQNDVKRIVFNSEDDVCTYSIKMLTMNKSENGDDVVVQLITYKCIPNRVLEFNFSSSDSPAEITISFDCLQDENENVIDFVEVDDDFQEEIWINFKKGTLETSSTAFYIKDGYLYQVQEDS